MGYMNNRQARAVTSVAANITNPVVFDPPAIGLYNATSNAATGTCKLAAGGTATDFRIAAGSFVPLPVVEITTVTAGPIQVLQR